MIVYRDMTYCRGDGCTSAHDCIRHLTKEVISRAKRENLLISQFAEPKKLECYTTKKDTNEIQAN